MSCGVQKSFADTGCEICKTISALRSTINTESVPQLSWCKIQSISGFIVIVNYAVTSCRLQECINKIAQPLGTCWDRMNTLLVADLISPSTKSRQCTQYIYTFFCKSNFYSSGLPGSWQSIYWPDCKAIPAYGLMMSVCPSVCPSVNIWLTSAFKFVLGHINQYRLDTLHGNRPWWDFLNCDLSLWPWPSIFLFKVT